MTQREQTQGGPHFGLLNGYRREVDAGLAARFDAAAGKGDERTMRRLLGVAQECAQLLLGDAARNPADPADVFPALGRAMARAAATRRDPGRMPQGCDRTASRPGS